MPPEINDRPSTALVLWRPPQSIFEEFLKSEVLRLWPRYEGSRRAKPDLAKYLYELQQVLRQPGKKGVGFDAWLKRNSIRHSTAYALIKQYRKREGLLEDVKPPASKKATEQKGPTLSNFGQGSAEYIPHPESADELLGLLARFFEQVPIENREQVGREVVEWINQHVFTPSGNVNEVQRLREEVA